MECSFAWLCIFLILGCVDRSAFCEKASSSYSKKLIDLFWPYTVQVYKDHGYRLPKNALNAYFSDIKDAVRAEGFHDHVKDKKHYFQWLKANIDMVEFSKGCFDGKRPTAPSISDMGGIGRRNVVNFYINVCNTISKEILPIYLKKYCGIILIFSTSSSSGTPGEFETSSSSRQKVNDTKATADNVKSGKTSNFWRNFFLLVLFLIGLCLIGWIGWCVYKQYRFVYKKAEP